LLAAAATIAAAVLLAEEREEALAGAEHGVDGHTPPPRPIHSNIVR
jgi:hypothetical protein